MTESMNRLSFAQKARNELVEIETKLDRLLDLQLEGNIFSKGK